MAALAKKKKSLPLSTRLPSKQTIFFLPPHRQTRDQAEGCDLLPGDRRGVLRSSPQRHKGTLGLSPERHFSLICPCSSHILFHFKRASALSASSLVCLLWLAAAVTEGIVQLEHDQCMYPRAEPCVSKHHVVAENRRAAWFNL